MRAMQDGAGQPRGDQGPAGDLGRPRREPDALTLGLIVFFIGLIAIVAVLLLAPMLTR